MSLFVYRVDTVSAFHRTGVGVDRSVDGDHTCNVHGICVYDDNLHVDDVVSGVDHREVEPLECRPGRPVCRVFQDLLGPNRVEYSLSAKV